MSNPNRAAQLNKAYKVLKKHYKAVTPPTRTVLEHLLYACCLENSKFEEADEAFAKVQQSFFDWNEVRVTTVAELAEMMNGLPHPSAAASNFKRALQAVFETHFAFDMELLKKQTLGKSEKDLEKYTTNNPFLIGYVAQHGLGGHAIPCGQAELDVLVILGIITDAEAEKKQVPGMERAIPKNKGVEFASLLHQLAADFQSAPFATRVRAILTEIDPDSKDRMPKRGAKKEPEPVEPTASKDSATAKKKPAPNLPPPKKGPVVEPTTGKSGKGERAKDADRAEPVSKASSAEKKTPSKHLAKKKPR